MRKGRGAGAREFETRSPRLLDVIDVHKRFGKLEVLRGITMPVAQGEVVAILGPSGSGKSTLLRCINHLEKIDGGRILFEGQLVGYREVNGKLKELREGEIARMRARMGMVFQRFNLFPHLTALGNVMEAPVQVLGKSKDEARETAVAVLTRVGLANKLHVYPAQLSGGQQQRVAIARALMQDPQIILADEPIASLDPMNAQIVMDTLKRINVEDGRMVIANLHTLDTARRYCDRVIGMRDGRIVFDGAPDQLSTGVAREIYGADESFNEAATSTAIPADTAADRVYAERLLA
jgi:phosphonate transport system ATP-binding protein